MSDLQKVSDGAGGYALLYVTADGGKHLAKECCCGGDCCLYITFDNEDVGTDPETQPYPASDLPATITLVLEDASEVTLTLDSYSTSWPYGYSYSGTDWNAVMLAGTTGWTITYSGADPHYASFDDWTNIDAGGASQSCLVGTYASFPAGSTLFIQDDFTGTYTVNGTDTITRDGAGSCAWLGAKTGGGTWMLDYGITTPYTWHLSSDGPSPTADDKTAPQDGPPGTYGSETIA